MSIKSRFKLLGQLCLLTLAYFINLIYYIIKKKELLIMDITIGEIRLNEKQDKNIQTKQKT